MLRGLSSRATRIRRPRLGAASMKNAMSAATAATGVVGTRPPNVPEPVVCDEPGPPNGDSGARDRRGDAGCALARFVVGCELGRLEGLDGGRQATAVVGPRGALAASSRWVGALCARSGVRALPE